MALGIDIYRKFQTVTNWPAVKGAGVTFVYVKLTDGGGIATAGPGDAQVNGAHSVGIPVGGYHYAQLSPTPERQAEILVGEVRRLGATGCVPALDLEAPFGADAGARDFGIRFCRRVAQLGFRPGVYMNNAFAKAIRPDGWGIPGLMIWIARYGAKPDAAAGRYDIHQYSSSGSIPGISASAVDLNESYTNNHLTQGVDELTPEEHEWLKALAALALNTPDMDGNGSKGDVSLVDFRQFLVDALKNLTAKQTVQTATLGTQSAKVDGLVAAVAALANEPDLTVDAVRQIVTDAVVQNLHITGSLEIGGAV